MYAESRITKVTDHIVLSILLVSSRPRFLSSSLSRFLASSLPRFLASSLPRSLAPSLPRSLAPSRPRFLASSLPRFLASSLPRFLASSLLPRFLDFSTPRSSIPSLSLSRFFSLGFTAPSHLRSLAPQQFAPSGSLDSPFSHFRDFCPWLPCSLASPFIRSPSPTLHLSRSVTALAPLFDHSSCKLNVFCLYF